MKRSVGQAATKLLYAHHKDDVVETLMLSLIYEGRFHTFAPVTFLDRMNLTVIRPLVYMKEADVIGFVHKHDVPVVKKSLPCRRTYSQRICQAAAASAEPGKSGCEGSDVHCGSEWSCGMEGT